ncbi:MAG: 7-cyano-7-deazaguanine synthase QueC [Thermodesulfovibrionales bacterium]
MVAPEGPGKAVVLLSGGVDSATVLAIVHAEGKELYALSFDYGQRHRRELESAKMVADFFGVKKHLIVNFNLRDIGGSALTSETEVPKAGVSNMNSSSIPTPRSPIPVTYVPARNTIFLSFALAWAEVLEAGHIYIGANAVDYSGYPDCRPEYLQSFERMANLATRASVEGKMTFSIAAPLLFMTKAEIVKAGLRHGLDYSLTWSCYDPQSGKAQESESGTRKLKAPSELNRFQADFVPCGLCDSCRFREKGFREAGIRDPLTS